MGTNYTQHCIVGLAIPVEEVKTIISPQEIEFQNRYDTRTGKVIGQERVVIKEQVCEYILAGSKSDCPHALSDMINGNDGHQLSCWFIYDVFYIGLPIVEASEYGRVELIEDEITLDVLKSAFAEASKSLKDPKLIFFSQIG